MTKGIHLRKAPTCFGDKYGDLVVVGEGDHKTDKNGHMVYHAYVACICGKQFSACLHSIRSGNTKSCGCRRKHRAIISPANWKHGKSRTKVYNAWTSMKDRCLNPKNVQFFLWGGRGITICDRWLKFENFYADMGDPSHSSLSLDRIDVNGHYDPGNCRWADKKTQNFNTRQTIPIIIGDAVVSFSDAARLVGRSSSSVKEYADKRGWTRQQVIDFYLGTIKKADELGVPLAGMRIDNLEYRLDPSIHRRYTRQSNRRVVLNGIDMLLPAACATLGVHKTTVYRRARQVGDQAAVDFYARSQTKKSS